MTNEKTKIVFKKINESFRDKLSTLELVDKYCKQCGTLVHRVSATSEGVVCCMCVLRNMEKEFPTKVSEPVPPKEIGFIAGWRFMNEFVHEDGRVFKKGVEVSELKGTLTPTDLSALKEKRKIKKANKSEKDQNKLVKEFTKKKKILKKKKKKEKK